MIQVTLVLLLKSVQAGFDCPYEYPCELNSVKLESAINFCTNFLDSGFVTADRAVIAVIAVIVIIDDHR